MIPLRDSTRTRRFPLITIAIIAANVLVFAYELGLDERELLGLFRAYGVVPSRIWPLGVVARENPGSFYSLVTATFLHGGWFHIAGNMLFLWVFGDNVEDRFGGLKYLLFYALVGAGANLAHVYANPLSHIPTVGASGAVAGVLGAYFLMFPRSRVLCLVPLGFFLSLMEVPAFVFLFVWFVLQLFNGVASLGVPTQLTHGVAWWAHVAGFAAGVVLVPFFRSRRSNVRT